VTPLFSLARGQTVLAPDALAYNPRGDVIFPSVVTAVGRLPNALGRYYLYYAPHDAPGGICVAFADDLAGPWREYEANPVIAARWAPHHTVQHVSSPHALWRDDLGELWLYYHGDNDRTRWATSRDGIHFEYGGVAIHAETLGMDGASYARVFPSPFAPATPRFLMVLLLYEYEEDSWDRFARFGLYGAWSEDGRSWRVVADPIVGDMDCAANEFVCSPSIFEKDGAVWLAYHLDRAGAGGPFTDTFAIEIDWDLRPRSMPQLVCARQVFGSHNQRIADPYFFNDGARWHLFGAIGPRLRQSIGLAVCDPVG